MHSLENLKKLVVKGDRVSLGKAITLVESNKASDRKLAGELLASILPKTGNAIRIGITGVPGVGKSTFIEALGQKITSEGKKLAVLAIDPSSPQSKGSILGDKTRMNQLAANQNAFIRPSATGGRLGGVAHNTMETVLLCEAAGYDVIIIETVGVGQSEVAVKNMTDVFILLMLAGAGDELQGIKRGIMEMADLLVINKADGDNIAAAKLAKKAYENAIHLFSGRETGWVAPVLTSSAVSGKGIDSVWEKLIQYHTLLNNNGSLAEIRNNQKKYWLEQTLSHELMLRIKEDARVLSLLPELESKVLKNKITPMQAVEEILHTYFENK